jgi:type IX secretion system PorP/SprF family membrane protein
MTNSYKRNGYPAKITRMIVLLTYIGSMITTVQMKAQDIHFSQFYATPLLTNPAYTGMTGENLRFANDFRNQWGKIGVPFRTFYTSLDKKITISNQSYGIGGAIIHDQSSAYDLAADEFLVSLSYSKIINNNQFVIGLQPGFAYKSYNLNGVTFGSQFDGSNQIFNSNLPSSENNLAGSLQYFDMNIGLFWRTLVHNIMPSVGFSVSHFLNPVVSFSTSEKSVRLPMKISFQSQVNIPVTNRIDITPSILYSSVPGVNELLLGGVEGYSLNDFFMKIKKIYAITLVRVNPFTNFDALILGGGVKFSKFDLGISYDINVSPLSKASYFNGAFEISLIYIGDRVRKNATEPCYIY